MKITTTDMYLAAWLNAQSDTTLINHTRENGRSSIFEFQGDNIDDLVKKYNNDDATIEVKHLAHSIRQLKNIMYNNSTSNQKNNSWTRKKNTLKFN